MPAPSTDDIDQYPSQDSVNSPGVRWFTVTPADANLARKPKFLIVHTSVAGNVVLRGQDDVDATFSLPIGLHKLELRPKQVRSTSLTGTHVIIAVW